MSDLPASHTPWTANYIDLAALPVETGAGIYFLFQGSTVVYVGKAVSVLARICDHVRQGRKKFDGYSYIACSPENLGAAEAEYIRLLLPEYNQCTFSNKCRKEQGREQLVPTELASNGGCLFEWDKTLKGFGLRRSPGGTESYIFQYRMGGRGTPTRRYTIGKRGSPWTPELARNEAERLKLLVYAGVDPKGDS